jgi:hypothetical protein
MTHREFAEFCEALALPSEFPGLTNEELNRLQDDCIPQGRRKRAVLRAIARRRGTGMTYWGLRSKKDPQVVQVFARLPQGEPQSE